MKTPKGDWSHANHCLLLTQKPKARSCTEASLYADGLTGSKAPWKCLPFFVALWAATTAALCGPHGFRENTAAVAEGGPKSSRRQLHGKVSVIVTAH